MHSCFTLSPGQMWLMATVFLAHGVSGEDSTIKLPVVNSAVQVTILSILLTLALVANASVILNITTDKLKLKMIHFILIRHVCITDFIGALFILPLPIAVVAKGEWTVNSTICTAVSTTTAACWTMHLVAVALYRADRCLAVWLPTGKYPVISIRYLNYVLLTTWLIALTGSYSATAIFGPTFQPALALCIPDVPLIFFIVVFSGYCIGLVSLTTGYLLAFVRRRRRRKRRMETQFVQAAHWEIVLEKQEESPPSPTPPHRPRSASAQPRPLVPATHCPRRGLSLVLPSTPSLSSTPSYERLFDALTHSVSLGQLRKKRSRIIVSRSLDECKCVSSSSDGSWPEATSANNDPWNGDANKEWGCHGDAHNTRPICHGDNSRTNKLPPPPPAPNGNLHPPLLDLEKTPSIQHSMTQSYYRTRHRNKRNYRSSSGQRALASYAVSVGHLLLYLPAMFVIGLNRGSLPPTTALFCGLVIYCEFIIQPIALLLISQRLRVEVCNMYL